MAWSDDLRTDATERLAREIAARRDRELLGAWRAGYDYLYELLPRQPAPEIDESEPFTIAVSVEFVPAHSPDRFQHYPGRVERFDLRSLDEAHRDGRLEELRDDG